METTIKEIYEQRPCRSGFAKLLYGVTGNEIFNEKAPREGIKDGFSLNICKQFNLLTEEEKSRTVSIKQILEINGVKDAFWALRTQDYKDYCLVLADVAESVLPIFEEKYPEDMRPKKTIEAIRKFHKGEISKEELREATRAAASASADASARVFVASSTASRAADARAAYDAAAAYAYAYAAADAYAAAYDAYDAAAYAAQWEKNEEILRRYL